MWRAPGKMLLSKHQAVVSFSVPTVSINSLSIYLLFWGQMQRKLKPCVVLVVALAGFAVAYAFLVGPFLASLVPPFDSSQNPVNIVFKFGVGAKNELDTFNGTFTKDLVIDGTTSTRLALSAEELKQVEQKLVNIGFFNLPESFPRRTDRWVSTQEDYYLRIEKGTTVKEASWNTNSMIDSSTEQDL